MQYFKVAGEVGPWNFFQCSQCKFHYCLLLLRHTALELKDHCVSSGSNDQSDISALIHSDP